MQKSCVTGGQCYCNGNCGECGCTNCGGEPLAKLIRGRTKELIGGISADSIEAYCKRFLPFTDGD